MQLDRVFSDDATPLRHHLFERRSVMFFPESVRKNGPFLAVLAAILLTGAALSLATLSLIARM